MVDSENIQVVKIGSKCIINGDGVDYGKAKKIGYEINELREEQGINSLLVVSGSVPLGMRKLGYDERPTDVLGLQRCAGVGQKELVQVYDIAFKGHAETAYLPLTYRNFENQEEVANIENRLRDDIEHGIVTLVNFHDGVSFRGITKDNDTLAADVALYGRASRLIILTSEVDGLMDRDGSLIAEVPPDMIEKYKELCNGAGQDGTGGMKTKIEAAEIATAKGIEVVIGNIRYKLKDILNGTVPRTVFLPAA